MDTIRLHARGFRRVFDEQTEVAIRTEDVPYVTSGQFRQLHISCSRKTTTQDPHGAMFDLIKAGEIDFVTRNEGTALRYLLRLSDIENVKDKFEQAISSRTLARQLGVDCEAIRRLTKAG